MPVKPIPEGYHAVTPYLTVKRAADAIEFYKKVFGATEKNRMNDPKGGIMHAELRIGDSVVMLSDEHPEMGGKSPESIGGTATSLLIYVENVDDIFRKAITSGARERRPVEDQFYGDRVGTIQDPFGHVWSIATHKEDVKPQEMQKRFEDMMKKHHDKAA